MYDEYIYILDTQRPIHTSHITFIVLLSLKFFERPRGIRFCLFYGRKGTARKILASNCVVVYYSLYCDYCKHRRYHTQTSTCSIRAKQRRIAMPQIYLTARLFSTINFLFCWCFDIIISLCLFGHKKGCEHHRMCVFLLELFVMAWIIA